MTRTYATPLAFRAALEARIAERARSTGRTMNRVRQLLVMERFLVRVFDKLDAVVLKGGLVLELRLDRARTTRDVDLRVTVDPDELLDRLREAARLPMADGLVFEVEPDADHPTIEADGLRYEGQRYRATAMLAGRRYGDAFGVDVAIGEPIVGSPDAVGGVDLLTFVGLPVPVFRAYPVATHVAEKLHAYTMPRPRPNSRVKDLPDIALLATVAELDGASLLSAVHATFAHRATHAVPTSLPEPAPAWEPVYARMAGADDLRWRTLGELTDAARAFLDPALAGHQGRWDAATWIWRDDRGGLEPENDADPEVLRMESDC
ncbi:MAG: nucleotidyl transferase AbiEii/AbiGii toxin family protein [Deltaproteobacteria bacterium]|nr:nucleotidyl transferase AbiEii/AbiGii toxin family protein [Deltaproteobacteria bacterium]